MRHNVTRMSLDFPTSSQAGPGAELGSDLPRQGEPLAGPPGGVVEQAGPPWDWGGAAGVRWGSGGAAAAAAASCPQAGGAMEGCAHSGVRPRGQRGGGGWRQAALGARLRVGPCRATDSGDGAMDWGAGGWPVTHCPSAGPSGQAHMRRSWHMICSHHDSWIRSQYRCAQLHTHYIALVQVLGSCR